VLADREESNRQPITMYKAPQPPSATLWVGSIRQTATAEEVLEEFQP
jgi:hypothetical protein